MKLEGTGRRAESRASTWGGVIPVQSVVKVADSNSTLNVNRSGKPGAYVLYDGTGCTIDTANAGDVGIAVNASYVIFRGFTIRNARQSAGIVRILVPTNPEREE